MTEADLLTQDEVGELMYEDIIAKHTELGASAEGKEDHSETVARLEVSFAQFETDFSLEELFAITNITREEAESHPVREPARLALYPIVEDLKFLKEKTNIPPDDLAVLKAKYTRISQAVGVY